MPRAQGQVVMRTLKRFHFQYCKISTLEKMVCISIRSAFSCVAPRGLTENSIWCMTGSLSGSPVLSVASRKKGPLYLLEFNAFMDMLDTSDSLQRPWPPEQKAPSKLVLLFFFLIFSKPISFFFGIN